MANFFTQISVIFQNARLSTYGKRSLWKIIFAGLLLWLAIYLFILANQIPYNKVHMEIITEGPQYVDMDLTLAIGNHSNKDYLRDSSMNRLIPNSGEWGRRWRVTAKQTPEEIHSHLWDKGLIQILEDNPQLLYKIDSVNARIFSYFSFETNSVLPYFTRKLQDRIVQKNFKNKNYYINDTLGIYIVDERMPYKNNSFEGTEQVFFKDSIVSNGLEFYSFSHSRNFNVNNPFYGNVNRELKDISRSYTHIRIFGTSLKVDGETETISESFWADQLPDNFKLTIDFGCPVSVAKVQPDPDTVGLTYVVYTDPEKLKNILGKSDLLFFVKYLENENRQSMRLFWLTTIITALVTWIVTVAWKWIEYSNRRKRFLKRQEIRKNL